MMGLAGLTNIRTSKWSESIKCPMCRQDLDIYFCDKIPPKIKVPLLPEKELEILDDYEINDTIISEENIAYINHILKNQSLNNGANVNMPLPQVDIPRRTMPVVGRRTREDYMNPILPINNTTNITDVNRHNDEWTRPPIGTWNQPPIDVD